MASASDFTLPDGKLDTSWFPEIDHVAFLDARIKEAEDKAAFSDLTKTKKEKAEIAYVYEKAYRHIYRRKSEDPNQWAADEQGSMQVSNRQVARWKEFADRKRSKWQRLASQTDSSDTHPQSTTVVSRSSYT